MKRRCLRLNKRILIILKYFKYSTLNSHMHQGHLTYGKAFSILQRFPFAGLVLNRTNSGKGRLVEQVCRSSLLSGWNVCWPHCMLPLDELWWVWRRNRQMDGHWTIALSSSCHMKTDRWVVWLCKYKYQLNIDGTVAAYRLPYLLAGDSVVLKQDSPYYEFFYKQLRPYEHYIPVKADLSDLLDRIQWAKDHNAEVSSSGIQLLLDCLDLLFRFNFVEAFSFQCWSCDALIQQRYEIFSHHIQNHCHLRYSCQWIYHLFVFLQLRFILVFIK